MLLKAHITAFFFKFGKTLEIFARIWYNYKAELLVNWQITENGSGTMSADAENCRSTIKQRSGCVHIRGQHSLCEQGVIFFDQLL